MSCSAQPIRLLITAEIRLYREGLDLVLRHVDSFDVVATASSWRECTTLVEEVNPDVVLVDTLMESGVLGVRGLLRAFPETRVVALAVPNSDESIVACAEAGISGYVVRDASVEELTSVVEAVVRGEFQCSPTVAAQLARRLATLSDGREPEGLRNRLTRRELEIVDLVARGMTNKEIARQLSIATSTVKNHVHNVLDKMNVHRRGEAVAVLRERKPGGLLLAGSS